MGASAMALAAVVRRKRQEEAAAQLANTLENEGIFSAEQLAAVQRGDLSGVANERERRAELARAESNKENEQAHERDFLRGQATAYGLDTNGIDNAGQLQGMLAEAKRERERAAEMQDWRTKAGVQHAYAKELQRMAGSRYVSRSRRSGGGGSVKRGSSAVSSLSALPAEHSVVRTISENLGIDENEFREQVIRDEQFASAFEDVLHEAAKQHVRAGAMGTRAAERERGITLEKMKLGAHGAVDMLDTLGEFEDGLSAFGELAAQRATGATGDASNVLNYYGVNSEAAAFNKLRQRLVGVMDSSYTLGQLEMLKGVASDSDMAIIRAIPERIRTAETVEELLGAHHDMRNALNQTIRRYHSYKDGAEIELDEQMRLTFEEPPTGKIEVVDDTVMLDGVPFGPNHPDYHTVMNDPEMRKQMLSALDGG